MTEMAIVFGASAVAGLWAWALARTQRKQLTQLAQATDGQLIRGALHGEHEGIDYRLRTNAGQDARAIISVVCPSAGHLRITRRRAFDRIEAWLPHTALSYGDARFKQRYVVQTRDPALGHELLADPEVRSAVDTLFAEGAHAVHVDGERVKATTCPAALGKQLSFDRLAVFLAPLARIGLAAAHAAERGLPQAPRHDPLVRASWAVLVAAALAGMVGTVVGLEHFDPIEPWPLVLTGIGAGWLAAVLTALVLIPLLSRRSSPGRTLVPMLVLAVLTLPFTGIGAVASANGLLDQGAAAVTDGLTPTSKVLRHRKQSRDVTRVEVEAQRPDPTEGDVPLTLDFPASAWPRWGSQTRVWVTLRPGALGHPWLADYGVTGLDDA